MRYLIIGFGAAGANAAEAIRRAEPTATVTVLDGEGRSFYLRLDLEGLFQHKPLEQLQPRTPAYWQEKQIEVLAGRAQSVNLIRQQVTMADGRSVPFDRLLIASGAVPRSLPTPGHDLSGVIHYHTLDHAEHILTVAPGVKKAVVIGGGILGLELAHAGVDFGWDVTLLVRGEFPGSPIADPESGKLVEKALEKRGVHVVYHEETTAFSGNGSLREVHTKSGRSFEADLAAVCIGIEPDVRWLENSDLLEGGRLIVNEQMQTSHPYVFAAGDAAVVRKSDGRLVACHTWTVAQSQSRVAAANMSGGGTSWREEVLYNLDFLFDQEFAMIGAWDDRHLPGRVIHEFPEDTRHRTLVTNGGILESALLLGSRDGDRRLRKIVAAHPNVQGRLEKVLDPAVSPEEFLPAS